MLLSVVRMILLQGFTDVHVDDQIVNNMKRELKIAETFPLKICQGIVRKPSYELGSAAVLPSSNLKGQSVSMRTVSSKNPVEITITWLSYYQIVYSIACLRLSKLGLERRDQSIHSTPLHFVCALIPSALFVKAS